MEPSAPPRATLFSCRNFLHALQVDFGPHAGLPGNRCPCPQTAFSLLSSRGCAGFAPAPHGNKTMKRDSTGKFLREHVGCRVHGCEAPHRSKGFCRGHLSAFERGRIDASGNPVRNRCTRCRQPYVARRSDQRFCPECAPRRARERERDWREKNWQSFLRQVRRSKGRHRTRVGERERLSARRRRARLRTENPAAHRQQLDLHARHQRTLQQISLHYVRPKWRWTPQEIALLKRMYRAVVSEHDWKRLFSILGRSYVAIRRKIAELRRRRTA